MMSGQYSGLLIGLGVVSAGFATIMSRRINGHDDEGLPLHMMPRLPAYMLWLIKQIIVANISVGRVILSNTPNMQLFWITASQKTQACIAAYANSITLTPGTVTVDIDGDRLLIHALNADFASDIKAGTMDKKVRDTEDSRKATS